MQIRYQSFRISSLFFPPLLLELYCSSSLIIWTIPGILVLHLKIPEMLLCSLSASFFAIANEITLLTEFTIWSKRISNCPNQLYMFTLMNIKVCEEVVAFLKVSRDLFQYQTAEK